MKIQYSKKQIEKLENFFQKEIKKIQPLLLPFSNDGFVFMNSYYITKENDEWVVSYFGKKYLFDRSNTALAWTIAHSHKDYTLSFKIVEYSRLVLRYSTEIDFMNTKKNKNDIVLAKISEIQHRKNVFFNELDKYIQRAKYIYHTQRIENHETQRLPAKK